MNQPTDRVPQRPTRGMWRGRGGNHPNFYFRRNGRTIPAGTGRKTDNPEPTNEATRGRIAMPWRRCSRNVPKFCDTLTPSLSASFLQPEHYVAPADAQKAQCITVKDPAHCEGWGLYFPWENYVPGNSLSRRILALSAHFSSDSCKYNLIAVLADAYFKINLSWLTRDELLMHVWPSLVYDIVKYPKRTLATLAAAMHKLVAAFAQENDYCQSDTRDELYVPRYTRRLRKIHVQPVEVIDENLIRNISSSNIDEMYAVRGVVTHVGDSKMYAAWICYKCSSCKHEFSIRVPEGQNCGPYCCKGLQCSAKSGFLEIRSSPYTQLRSRQFCRIEEAQLQMLNDFDLRPSSSIDIELKDDLVDALVVGQEVVATGILKLWRISGNLEPTTLSDKTSKRTKEDGRFHLRVISLQNVEQFRRAFSKSDLEAIYKINNEKDTFKLLVQSLAPEVYGNEVAKAGCILTLFGSHYSQITESLNVLLIGEPGTGKSKILQMCTRISERSDLLRGKLGLQAGQKIGLSLDGPTKRGIQAGVLVAANSGHCIIDDIDKIYTHQSSVLQVLQTRETNSPQSSLFCSIGTFASVIASANPQHGRYDRAQLLAKNVRIMPTLLNEFHLVFVLHDKPDMRKDGLLNAHISAMQSGAMKALQIAKRYEMKPMSDGLKGCASNLGSDSQHSKDDLVSHLTAHDSGEEYHLLPLILMKKYIAYAQENIKPIVSDEAVIEIKRVFNELQELDDSSNAGHGRVGIGQFVGLIQLCLARARINLSFEVTSAHVRDVKAIVMESMIQASLIDDIGKGNENMPATKLASKSKTLKCFLVALQRRASAINRNLFEVDDLKDVGRRAGITADIANLVDMANEQGFLLKKGINLYELLKF